MTRKHHSLSDHLVRTSVAQGSPRGRRTQVLSKTSRPLSIRRESIRQVFETCVIMLRFACVDL